MELFEASVLKYLDLRLNNFRTYPKIFFLCVIRKVMTTNESTVSPNGVFVRNQRGLVIHDIDMIMMK